MRILEGKRDLKYNGGFGGQYECWGAKRGFGVQYEVGGGIRVLGCNGVLHGNTGFGVQ